MPAMPRRWSHRELDFWFGELLVRHSDFIVRIPRNNKGVLSGWYVYESDSAFGPYKTKKEADHHFATRGLYG